MSTADKRDEDDIDVDDEDGTITYETIWSNLVLAGELVITVAAEDEASLKTGLKNLKHRQAVQNRADGLPPVQGQLVFVTSPSKEIAGAVDISLSLNTRKGAVKVLGGIKIPDNSF